MSGASNVYQQFFSFQHLKNISTLYSYEGMGYILLELNTGSWIGGVGRLAIMVSVVALVLVQVSCREEKTTVLEHFNFILLYTSLQFKRKCFTVV